MILSQPTKFHLNRTALSEVMTSYWFFKMAAMASQFYFQLCIWWLPSYKKVKMYFQTTFPWDVSIHCGDITTFSFWKYTAAIFEFYIWFQFLISAYHRHVILHWPIKLHPNWWQYSNFQDSSCQPHWICSVEMVDHPQSATQSLSLVLKVRLDQIYSFRYTTIFRFWRFGLKLLIYIVI